ncbi:uncharacterized protein LOC130510146 [Raphanus sativus]|uniref:Uncharacterized protein LOC130510146 n=1 Tax=Raphanus sativus TaxID=3726 RepID=A0A9W3DFI1_RAPSA|nr:uncharacterized protein LOC130510146 [Raphanus sativus]
MKKKKPKKSPAKTPPKSPPQASRDSPPVKSTSENHVEPLSDSKIVSDAQIGSSAAVDAQQSIESSDSGSDLNVNLSSETEIAAPVADPSPARVDSEGINLESSSGALALSSSVVMVEKEPCVAAEPSQTDTMTIANAEAKLQTSSSRDAEMAPPLATQANGGSEQQVVNKTAPSDAKTSPPINSSPQINLPALTVKAPEDTWCAHAKGKRLSRKGEAFTLPSGEACIMIPNSVIEKNRKSWEPFVLGQFYSDPPSQGTLHNIVNGIWSKNYRDIAVSKMEGFAFLFRIPNAATRHRVITQRLWQIEGQTMFVDKWEPGVVPSKPELTSAPIWLELRNVPLQFFNEDGLERIAGLVGQPKFLHPTTANKTNLEVAKVFTIIDPRKPLPEAVNVQFQSGAVSRVLVSSPNWMPPVCGICKEVGHVSKRCPSATKTCALCKAEGHATENCPK